MSITIRRFASTVACQIGLERGHLRAPFQLKMGCIFDFLPNPANLEAVVFDAIAQANNKRLTTKFFPKPDDHSTKIVEKAITSSIDKTVFRIYKQQVDFHLHENPFAVILPPNFEIGPSNSIQAKADIKPSLALMGLFQQKTHFDSSSAIQAIYFKALLDVIGIEKFDAIFSHQPLRLKFTKPGLDWCNPVSFFTEFLASHSLSTSFDLIPFGAKVSFRNVPWYPARHPAGIHQSIQVLRVDQMTQKPLFYGLGLTKLADGSEICDYLLEKHTLLPSDLDRWVFSQVSKEAYLSHLTKTHSWMMKNFQKTTRAVNELLDEIPIEEKLELLIQEIGFSGLQETEKLSSLIVAKLIKMPIDKIKHPTFIDELSKIQIERIAEFLIEAPDRSVRIEEPMSKPFLDWFDRLG